MIIIIFISLAIVYFLVQYFENRRWERNYEHHERRRESFTNLLNSLKDRNTTTEQKKNENEP